MDDSTTASILRGAGAFLCKQQRQDGAICDLSYEIFDIWETVNSIKCLALLEAQNLFKAPTGLIAKALDYVKQAEVDNGLVIHNGRGEFGDRYCIETSVEYLMALKAAGDSNHASPRAQTLRNLQHEDGRWSIDSPTIPGKLQDFPSVTAFAILGLHTFGETPLHAEAALNYISLTQVDDGSWGAAWEYYGTPYYPLAFITHALAVHRRTLPLARAKAFLTRNQRPDGAWYHVWEGQTNVPSDTLQTALALQACHHCGLGIDSETVQRGRFWLQRQQLDDGSFPGGYFPIPPNIKKVKVETVYATTQAVSALLLGTNPPS